MLVNLFIRFISCKHVCRFFVFTLLLVVSSNSYSDTFSQAKIKLKQVYKDFPHTFYCGCEILWITNKKLVPSTNCAYSPRNSKTKSGKPNQRALRIEWEHIVPASEIGHQRQCWQNGGRKNCTKNDPEFSQIEGDYHNLQPSIGEVNADRSNFKYGMIPGEVKVYGSCDAEVDFKSRLFEPTDSVRGDIARTYFYFEFKYGLNISNRQRNLFNAWAKLDPVDSKECSLHKVKSRLQGNTNPFVEKEC